MTLAELLAALAIASALMVAALTTTTGVSRSVLAVQKLQDRASLEAGLRGLLEADVSHAYGYRTTEKGIGLQTLARLDQKGLELEHIDSTVTYEVRKVDRESWLVRTQLSQANQPATELVCRGVRAIRLEGDSDPGPQGNWQRIPPAPVIALDFEPTQQGTLRLPFRTRW